MEVLPLQNQYPYMECFNAAAATAPLSGIRPAAAAAAAAVAVATSAANRQNDDVKGKHGRHSNATRGTYTIP